MSNVKWGIITAVGAFLISIILGIASGVAFLYIVLRAVIFAVVFFGVGFGLRFVIESFLPELLLKDDDIAESAVDQPGQRINIVLDNTGEFAVPELYKTKGGSDELGNIEDLVSGVFTPHDNESSQPRSSSPQPHSDGVDRISDSGYNMSDIFGIPVLDSDPFEEMPVFGKKPASRPVFTPSFGDDDSGLGGLPDLDMMASAFSSAYSDSGSSPAASFTAMPPPSLSYASAEEEELPQSGYNKGSKPQSLQGNFDPKDIAKGISTVLSKDK